MTTSALRRQVKNIVHNYSEAEIKVREATSNDPWGPPSSLMSEIADLTFNTVAFAEVMGMIWRRLNDSGKNWRHVYKALTLLDYLLKTGSDKVAHQCRENLYTIQTLKDFQYVDRDGKDQGINVREKVKQVMGLLKDEERLKQERTHALKTKERMALEGSGIGSGQLSYGRRSSHYGDEFSRTRGSPSSYNSSSSSPRFTSDLEQARPQTTGEEELQLQLALAMSREEAEKEVRSWRGDDSPLSKGAGGHGRRDQDPEREEEKEGEKLKTSQSSILDLADIFGPGPAPPSTHSSADPWDIPGLRSTVEPAGSSWGPSADPWSPAPSGDPLSRSQPWDLPSMLSSSEPWRRTPGPPLSMDPWVKDSPHHKPSGSGTDPWGATLDTPSTPTALGGSAFDLFAKLPESTEAREGSESAQALPSARSGSPDLDLFGDPLPSSKQNGTKESDAFDLGGLGGALTQAGKDGRACQTPESFLGPSASSLVNLDSLVMAPQPTKTRNPFLSGLSAPSPTNPFSLGEQCKPTLNQMRTGSPGPNLASSVPMGAPVGSMTYSTSLPLPLSSVPSGMTLPASVSVFPQAGTFPQLPGTLPQPLLPMSGSVGPLNPSSQSGTNPFL
ncbi:epsin-3 isoform X6 [Phascolarctos cinereus]|uniref:Epsin-3 isoform X6 n=1 Tax=Phascolarctos cinereus TaxID=38626 RepID=A0A6P5JB58_PHACI|nr:epsin-3 isoform X6 [Phascolarctos cinereus]